MKYFFTAGIQTHRRRSFQYQREGYIAEIFKKEDPTRRLSDQES